MTRTAGAIATPHHLATLAGRRAFDEGGSAVDAALAAAVVLTVVYPHMSGIGGDVQAVLARPDGTVSALGGSGAAARAADAAALASRHAGMPVHGVHPITVPGMVAAWGELHGAAGRLPWRRLFEDAIGLARDGHRIAGALGRDLKSLQARLATDAGLRGVFFHADGRVMATGDTVRQPALAATLESVAAGGPRAFYDGDVGARLVAGLRRLGSPLEVADLAAHRSEWLDPLVGRFAGIEVLTTPPVSQGHVLLQLLAAITRMEGGPVDPLGPAAARLARLCALTAHRRDQVLGDPRHVEVDVPGLLSQASIDALVEHAADPGRPLPGAPAGDASPRRPDGDTIAIAAMDADGTALTLIQSVFHAFGAGILEPDTGIVCHNRGAAFTLTPGPGQLVGGRRPPSTLTASLLRRDGRIEAALGAMGGKSQPQIQMQLLQRLATGASPDDALAAPRWVQGSFGPDDAQAVLAEGRVDARTRRVLADVGVPLVIGEEQDDRVGHAQFVRRAAGGGFEASTDPRADGLAPTAH